jgi:hypothetical protein
MFQFSHFPHKIEFGLGLKKEKEKKPLGVIHFTLSSLPQRIIMKNMLFIFRVHPIYLNNTLYSSFLVSKFLEKMIR